MKPSLDRLFAPRSVTIVGASTDPGRLTGRPLQILRRHGFEGEITAVHPRATDIDGIRTYPGVSDLPHVPDVALVMLPAHLVPETARTCGEKGIGHLVVLSSGFEETDEGGGLSDELRAISEEFGMGVVGPNSEGLWCLPSRTILTFGSAAMRDDLVSGPIAVLSQSGSIGASVMRQLNDTGVGADVFVSVGNETVLGVADYLTWLVDNTAVRVVVCFLEGLSDGRAFLEAASSARAAGIAVVVLKAGSSDQGRLASASHTGKISSAGVIYRSLLAQAGVAQVETIEQLAGAASVLAGPSLRKGGEDAGLTVIGLSGGSRSIIADAMDDLGIPLTRLQQETSDDLAEFIPDFGVTDNPIDPTGQVLSDPELFPRTVRALAADPGTRALLVQYANGGVGLLDKHLPTLVATSREHDLPIVVGSLLDQLPGADPLRRSLAAAGLTYAHDPTTAVHLAALLFRLQEESWAGPLPRCSPRSDPRRVTDWDSVAALLQDSPVTTPRQVVAIGATPPEDLSSAMAAAGLDLPVAVKPSPDDVQHKTELGLVHLGISSPSDVTMAVTRISESLGPTVRVVVQEMVPSGPELLVVLQDDPDFGPVMGLGPGGFFVELMADVAYVALPATPAHVLAALERTRLRTLLRGYRGQRAVDVPSVAAKLASLGEVFAQLTRPPRTLELNPVIVTDGGRLVAIDALVEPGPVDT